MCMSVLGYVHMYAGDVEAGEVCLIPWIWS